MNKHPERQTAMATKIMRRRSISGEADGERQCKIQRAGERIREMESLWRRVATHDGDGSPADIHQQEAKRIREIESALNSAQTVTLIAKGGLRIPVNLSVARREAYFETLHCAVGGGVAEPQPQGFDHDMSEFDASTLLQCVSMIYRGQECASLPVTATRECLALLSLASRWAMVWLAKLLCKQILDNADAGGLQWACEVLLGVQRWRGGDHLGDDEVGQTWSALAEEATGRGAWCVERLANCEEFGAFDARTLEDIITKVPDSPWSTRETFYVPAGEEWTGGLRAMDGNFSLTFRDDGATASAFVTAPMMLFSSLIGVINEVTDNEMAILSPDKALHEAAPAPETGFRGTRSKGVAAFLDGERRGSYLLSGGQFLLTCSVSIHKLERQAKALARAYLAASGGARAAPIRAAVLIRALEHFAGSPRLGALLSEYLATYLPWVCAHELGSGAFAQLALPTLALLFRHRALRSRPEAVRVALRIATRRSMDLAAVGEEARGRSDFSALLAALRWGWDKAECASALGADERAFAEGCEGFAVKKGASSDSCGYLSCDSEDESDDDAADEDDEDGEDEDEDEEEAALRRAPFFPQQPEHLSPLLFTSPLLRCAAIKAADLPTELRASDYAREEQPKDLHA